MSGSPPPRAGRDAQFLDDPGEHLAALGVGGALLVLDRVPLGMARHRQKLPKSQGKRRTILPRIAQARSAHPPGNVNFATVWLGSSGESSSNLERLLRQRPSVSLPTASARMTQTSAPLIPRAALVVAENRLDREAGASPGAWPSAGPRACGTSARSGGPSRAGRGAPRTPDRRSSSLRRRSWRTDSTSVTVVFAPRRPCRLVRRWYSLHRGRSGTRSMPKSPPGRITRATESQRGLEIAFARQRLEDAVRRHHQAEAAPGSERQLTDVAADEERPR